MRKWYIVYSIEAEDSSKIDALVKELEENTGMEPEYVLSAEEFEVKKKEASDG